MLMLRRFTSKSRGLLAKIVRGHSNQQSTEQGLTLIESLAAIVIFGFAITAVTQPLVIAMATRVRAYRAQQSLQLAQGEIEKVRLLVEQSYQGQQKPGDTAQTALNTYISKLPPASSATGLRDVGPPTAFIDCRTTQPSATQGCQVLVNGATFGIQTFRLHTIEPPVRSLGNRTVPVAFKMGVRVYPPAALSQNNLSNLSIEPASLAFSERSDGPAPLAVSYVPIVRSDLANSIDDYKELIKNFNP
jgi:prepilin-type N-terminal cleavage/methylation domain-containing protein